MSGAATNDTSECAACGKGGDGPKTCNGCKVVHYCSRECQVEHRPTHRAACKKRAAELFDQRLFQQPPPADDCPLCEVRLPFSDQTSYLPCCGRVLCRGCMDDVHWPMPCPYCGVRLPANAAEFVQRVKNRVEKNDAEAVNQLGCMYRKGKCGLPWDQGKALELFLRAAELGSITARNNVGRAYQQGRGVGRDIKKAVHHFQIAAMGGEEESRYCLGDTEFMAGNMTRAYQHFRIAARAGDDDSMERVGMGLKSGSVTEDEFEETVRAYREAKGAMWSEQRGRWMRKVGYYIPNYSQPRKSGWGHV